MRLNNTKNNDIKVLAFGVASTPRTMVRGGIGWTLPSIYKRSNGLRWNLSGKPTNWNASEIFTRNELDDKKLWVNFRILLVETI